MKTTTRNGKTKQSKPVTLTVEKVFLSPTNPSNPFVNVKFEGLAGLYTLAGSKLLGAGHVYVVISWEAHDE
jgi:hypothetical protein